MLDPEFLFLPFPLRSVVHLILLPNHPSRSTSPRQPCAHKFPEHADTEYYTWQYVGLGPWPASFAIFQCGVHSSFQKRGVSFSHGSIFVGVIDVLEHPNRALVTVVVSCVGLTATLRPLPDAHEVSGRIASVSFWGLHTKPGCSAFRQCLVDQVYLAS